MLLRVYVKINSCIDIEVIKNRFKRSISVGNCVFVCVDSIVTRKHIWDAVQDKVNFFCDGRMSAEVLRVVTACDWESKTHENRTVPMPDKTAQYLANLQAESI